MGKPRELLDNLALRILPRSYTEFHGGIKNYLITTPWYSVSSVVFFFLKEIIYD
jgi:hypothetical protein